MQSEQQTLAIPQEIQLGLEHHQAGRLSEAERIYQRVLQDEPNNPDALHLLGVIAHQVGRNEISVQLIARAIRYFPLNPHFLNNLGEANRGLRRLEDAVASYDKALTIKPDYTEALTNRGNALRELKRYDEALASHDKALTINPDFAEALSGRGSALQELKRYDEALVSYDKALTIKPDFAEALINRGNTLQELRRYDEALASYDKALTIKPDFAEASNNRGNALRELRRYDEALASCDKALTINPDYAEALTNRGNVLQELERYDEALASHDKALTIKPDFAEALSSRGNALQELKRYEEALSSYDQALTFKPDYVEALSNRGPALQELNRYDDALASYDKAITINPDYASAHLNEGLCRLLIGDFERGWKKYEWRWKSDSFDSTPRNFSQPLWLGKEEIAGKTILLHAEQGLGDTIQFARYTQEVARNGAKVILEVQPPLKSLLSNISGAHQVLSRGEQLPEFDFHCPLLSLPLAFNTRMESVPATIPYLSVKNTAVSAWRGKLSIKGTRLIGLCWKGNPRYKRDRDRSLCLTDLRPLLACPGVRFVSLQKELDEEERAIADDAENFIHLGADFNDTAEIVGALDLVISVDTAWAHLAGAFGKPLWILLPIVPHWNWLLDRDDNPWYPTARLFRQLRRGDREGMIVRVRDEILRNIS